MKIIDLFLKWKFPLFLGILISVLYLHFFENRAVVEINMSVSQKSWFTIYWADSDQSYSKYREVNIRVIPGQQKYRFYGVDLRSVDKLRIDTHDYEGEVTLRKMLFTQNGYKPLELKTETEFAALTPLEQVESFKVNSEGLQVVSKGSDPQFELLVTLTKADSRIPIVSIHIAFIFFCVILFFIFTENFREERDFIPLYFAAAFVLIVVMASISKENVHPDEYVHLFAGEYYKTNWLPPVVDDPEIHHTYSVYGVSRLNSQEISYMFTGKLAEFVSSFKVSDLLSFRLFNVLLFGLLLLYLLKNSAARWMAAPLLISPQFWYVFSYCNSDAFALALSFLVGSQTVLPNSLLNSYLQGERKRGPLIFIVLTVFCALLFLLKKNYLFFIVFLAAYQLWRLIFRVEQERRRSYLKRLTAIILVAMSLVGLRYGADYYVNGMDRGERLEQIREKLATPLYKPSTPLEDQHSFLNRKAHGDSLETIIVVDRWFEKTYRSAFGMYGYFTAVSTDAYYNAERFVGVALLVMLSLAILFRGGISGNLLYLIFIACAGGLIGISLYHSWTADYQTQGRYLFPIVPMFCVVLYHSRNLIRGAVFKLMLTAMFLLSVYSFVFVGLLQLPKMS